MAHDYADPTVPRVRAIHIGRGRLVVKCPYCGQSHYHNLTSAADSGQRMADCFRGEYILEISREEVPDAAQ